MTSQGKKIAVIVITTGVVILLLLWWYIWKSQPRLFEPGVEPPRPLTQDEIKKAEEGLTAPAGVEPTVPKKVLQSLSAPEPKATTDQGANASVPQGVLDSLSAPAK